MSVAAPLLTLEQAAQRLQVSTSWLYKRAAAYAVPHVRLGRSIRFTEEHIAELIAAASKQPPATRLRSTA